MKEEVKPWKIFAELEQGVPYIKEETNDTRDDKDDDNKEDNKNVQDTI